MKINVRIQNRTEDACLILIIWEYGHVNMVKVILYNPWNTWILASSITFWLKWTWKNLVIKWHFTWPYSQMMRIRQASSVRFWILTLIFIYTYISYGVIQNNIVIWFVMVCLFWLFLFFHLHVHFLKNLTLIPSIRFWQSFTNCAQIIQGKVKILNNDLVHFKFF